MFVITPDASVRYAKLRTNECQIARYPNPADLPTLRTNPDIKVQEADVVGTNYLRFRVDRKPLDDRRVRLALAQAIDMNGLVSAVFQGAGTPAASLVPPSLWGHERAQALRARSGGGKEAVGGGRVSQRLHLDLWAIPVVRAYMPNGRRAAEMIQSDWAALGVTANITTFEWGEYLKRSRAGEPSVGMLGGTWDYPDPSELLLGFTCNNPGNAGHWCNQVYTDAVQKANVVTNQDERAKLYIAADKAVYDDVFLIRLADVKAYVPVRKRRRVQAALSRRPTVRRCVAWQVAREAPHNRRQSPAGLREELKHGRHRTQGRAGSRHRRRHRAKAGGRLPLIGGGGHIGAPELLKVTGADILQGLMAGLANWPGHDHDKLAEPFIARTREPWFGHDSVFAYVHVLIFKEALECAGVADRHKVADAIAGSTCATGRRCSFRAIT